MNKQALNDVNDVKKINYFIINALTLGIVFRIFHYFYNRSLWMDEAYLTSSILRMNYTDLASKVLDYQQKAPLGFLWLAKFFVNQFGSNELSLRIVPLLCGIISLLLFKEVCRFFLKPYGQLFSICLFSFAPALIYHSVEIKQYSTECLATIISLYSYVKYKDSISTRNRLLWGAIGAIVIWFSFSVLFILAGIGIGMSFNDLLRKEWRSFFRNLLPFSIWLLSFLLNYIFFIHKHVESDWVVYWFKTYSNFMPFPPHTIDDLKWFPTNYLQMMDYPLGLIWNVDQHSNGSFIKILKLPLVATILLITGFIYLFKSDRKTFSILMLPILLMLFASGICLYPLLERFWVFISPVIVLIIAYGFEYYQTKIKSYLFLGLFLIIVLVPFLQSLYFLAHPNTFYKHKKSFVKESFVYINKHFNSGDMVYNYWNNSPGYVVYRKILPFKYPVIIGKDLRKQSNNLEDYNKKLQADFKKFSGKKRVWLIFNNQFLTTIGDLVDDPKWYYKNQLSPNKNLIKEVGKVGKPLKKIVYSDVSIYLFELKSL